MSEAILIVRGQGLKFRIQTLNGLDGSAKQSDKVRKMLMILGRVANTSGEGFDPIADAFKSGVNGSDLIRVRVQGL